MKSVTNRKSKSKTADYGSVQSPSVYMNHSEFLPRLNRARGQLAGIEKMISDGRYCVDILVQFRAVMAALRLIEVNIFEKHLKQCLSAAMHSKDEKEINVKITELTNLLTRRKSL